MIAQFNMIDILGALSRRATTPAPTAPVVDKHAAAADFIIQAGRARRNEDANGKVVKREEPRPLGSLVLDAVRGRT